MQTHFTDMRRLEGSISGHPVFSYLSVRAGTDLGLRSEGQTTITRLNGGEQYSVDSFFDIFYEIEFEGAPGSILNEMSGSTNGSLRMETGQEEQQYGACCYPDGTCAELDAGNCNTGDWRAEDSCDPNPCPQPGGGACCYPDGMCAELDESQCGTGDWRAGESCSPNPCPTPMGACCDQFGACTYRNYFNCGGFFLGEGTVCDPNPCPPPIDPCIAASNGYGTINLPPEPCFYLSPAAVHLILEGLPEGMEIHLSAAHDRFMNTERTQGGELGGEVEEFDSYLQVDLWGIGDLEGFQRTFDIPIGCEVHTAPRTPGVSVQDFETQMHRLSGGVFGDSDFDELQFTAGNDFGLPSPGQTVLTSVPGGDFNVDSFFDINYRIDFVGAPGGALDGLSGGTTATLNMQAGVSIPPPTGACCHQDYTCVETIQADCDTGDWRIFTECEPENPCTTIASETTTWGRIKTGYR